MRHSYAIAVLMLGLTATSAYAGNSTSELANSEPVSRFVVLRFEEGNPDPFRFTIDNSAPATQSSILQAGTTFAVDKDNGLVVNGMFLNPLKYAWSISEEASDDPTYESARQFVTAANSVFKGVTPKELEKDTEFAGSAAAAGSKSGRPKNGLVADLPEAPAPATDPIPLPTLYSTDLIEWVMWMDTPYGVFCRSTKETTDEFKKFRDALEEADKQLILKDGKAPSQRPANQFKELTGEILRELAAASTVAELRSSVSKANVSLTTLEKQNGAAKEAIDAVDASKIKWSDDPKCGNFGRYTQNTVTGFKSHAGDSLKGRVELVSQLKALVSSVEKFAKACDDKEEFCRIGDVKIPQGKMKDVTVAIRKRELKFDGSAVSIEEKEGTQVQFRVREDQTFILEFAPGVAFTTVSYPRFGTEEVDGHTVVAEAGREPHYFSAVGLLNIVPNFDWDGVPRPVVQMGLGTGEKYPLLLAGGGLRLLSPVDFSLTVGVAWSWTQRLSNLKVGDEVSGTADVEKDVHYALEPKPGVYVGVQTSF